jgi:hypothetical protein
MIRSHTFNGVKYRVDITGLRGICIVPNTTPEICLCENLKTKRGLIVAIHEAMHAECSTVPEEVVDRRSKELGTFLWRLGYRMKR